MELPEKAIKELIAKRVSPFGIAVYLVAYRRAKMFIGLGSGAIVNMLYSDCFFYMTRLRHKKALQELSGKGFLDPVTQDAVHIKHYYKVNMFNEQGE